MLDGGRAGAQASAAAASLSPATVQWLLQRLQAALPDAFRLHMLSEVAEALAELDGWGASGLSAADVARLLLSIGLAPDQPVSARLVALALVATEGQLAGVAEGQQQVVLPRARLLAADGLMGTPGGALQREGAGFAGLAVGGRPAQGWQEGGSDGDAGAGAGGGQHLRDGGGLSQHRTSAVLERTPHSNEPQLLASCGLDGPHNSREHAVSGSGSQHSGSSSGGSSSGHTPPGEQARPGMLLLGHSDLSGPLGPGEPFRLGVRAAAASVLRSASVASSGDRSGSGQLASDDPAGEAGGGMAGRRGLDCWPASLFSGITGLVAQLSNAPSKHKLSPTPPHRPLLWHASPLPTGRCFGMPHPAQIQIPPQP